MTIEIKRQERSDKLSRAVEFVIDGHPRVSVSQPLYVSDVCKMPSPQIFWTEPKQPDADQAEAIGRALIEAAEVYRQWKIETDKLASLPAFQRTLKNQLVPFLIRPLKIEWRGTWSTFWIWCKCNLFVKQKGKERER